MSLSGMPPPGGNGGVEMGGSSLDEPLTEFEVRDNCKTAQIAL